MRPTMVTGSGSGTAIETYRHTGALSGVTGWYSSRIACRTAVNRAYAANLLLALPFSVDRTGTIDLIAVRVTTVAGGANLVGRFGIYRATFASPLPPTTLVAEAAGTFSTAGLGWQQQAITAAVDTRYPYYLSMVLGHTGADPQFWGFDPGDLASSLGNRNTAAAPYWCGYESALAYPAALPGTFTAGGTRRTTNGPLIFVHYAT